MSITDDLRQKLDLFREDYDRLRSEIAKVIVGQREILDEMLLALIAGGHVLLEGVPGLGKTLTVRTLANALHLMFRRIQFTPDLMPADLIGTNIVVENPDCKKSFEFQRGPVFANVLLADEINRATPKTQSALLEAMQERQVTIADTTFPLPDPFWVLATQNPVEHEGVYLLPEAQLDRFSMMLRVSYPTQSDELQMLRRGTAHVTLAHLVTPSAVVAVRRLVQQNVYADDKIPEYIVRLGHATRKPADVGLADVQDLITLGLSPRSFQHVLALARVTAFFEGRDYVSPADVKTIFPDVARHRLVRSVRAEAEGVDVDAVVARILDAVAIP